MARTPAAASGSPSPSDAWPPGGWRRETADPDPPGGHGAQPATRPLALATGASSGIGRELTKQFAENGFDLIVAAGPVVAKPDRQVTEPGSADS